MISPDIFYIFADGHIPRPAGPRFPARQGHNIRPGKDILNGQHNFGTSGSPSGSHNWVRRKRTRPLTPSLLYNTANG